jgi:hypothetical protein
MSKDKAGMTRLFIEQTTWLKCLFVNGLLKNFQKSPAMGTKFPACQNPAPGYAFSRGRHNPQFLNMKNKIAFIIVGMFAAGVVWAADAPPASQVSDAIAKLKAATNYSWTVTTVTPADAPFTPPPIKGQKEGGGFARFSTQFGDNTAEAILKGDKVVFKGEEGWQLAAAGGGFSPDTFALHLARNGTAGDEAGIILKGVKELKALDGGAMGGDLSAATATDLLTFGPRHSDAKADPEMPGPKGAKGSAKFWVKDGALVKYQTHLTGTVSFNGNDTVLDFTRTTEIQEVGTTKMDIPAEAKKKLEAPPPAK